MSGSNKVYKEVSRSIRTQNRRIQKNLRISEEAPPGGIFDPMKQFNGPFGYS